MNDSQSARLASLIHAINDALISLKETDQFGTLSVVQQLSQEAIEIVGPPPPLPDITGLGVEYQVPVDASDKDREDFIKWALLVAMQ